MSGRAAILRVDIITDSKGSGVTDTDSRLGKLGKTAGKVGKAVAIGAAAAGAAAVVVGKKLVDMGERAATSDARILQINQSMGLFGDRTEEVSNRLVKLAEKQARATGVDQNAIKATQAKLLTFKELARSADQVGGNFDRATKAAVDLEAAGFSPAEQGAVQLGKALNDPIKGMSALSRSGITFTEVEQKRIGALVESNKVGKAQDRILAAIEKQVGGTAKATANGTDRMKVAFSQVGERIGKRLVPMVDRAATFLVNKLLPAASRLGRYLGEKFGPAFAQVGGFITGKLIPAGQQIFAWFMQKIAPGLARTLAPVLAGVGKAFGTVRAAIQRNEPQLRTLLSVLGSVASFVAGKVMPILGKLAGAGFRVVGATISGVIDIIGSFISKIQAAIDKIKELIEWVRDKMPDLPDLNPFNGAADVTTIGTPLVGRSPSYDRRTGWTSAAAGDPTSWPSLSRLAAQAATPVVIDARTFVDVDGSGLVDINTLVDKLDGLLRRRNVRLGALVPGGAA